MNISFIMMMCLLVLVSCGKSNKKKSAGIPGVEATAPLEPAPTPEVKPETPPVLVTEAGEYKIEFKSLNNKSFKASAEGSLLIDGENIELKIHSKKAPMLRSIYQSLYTGECPTELDDHNRDGYIDLVEAKAKLTERSWILDSAPASSSDNHTVFPQTNLFGDYSYKALVQTEGLLKDLSQGKEKYELDFEKSVVLLQGHATYLRYPNSVESDDNLPVSETLPLACGTIRKK